MIVRSRKTQIERWLMKMPLMISCEEFETFIMQYLEGELPRLKRMVFDMHLKVCRECRDYLAAYKLSIASAKGAIESEKLPPVPEDLVVAILEAQKVSGPEDDHK